MPITKSAIKKMKKDRKREVVNKKRDLAYLKSIKKAKKTKQKKDISIAFSAIDKALKYKRIHKRKAARLKSNLISMINKKS